MAESIEQVEFKLGSTINFHVFRVEPSETKWYLNDADASITHARDSQFINRKAADFSDSGLYECKVDDKTIKAFNVIVYDLYKCDLGSTIDLRVNTDQCQEWTLHNKKVTSEGDPHIGFEKKIAAIKDSGRYECKVDGKVKCAFYVLVYDFDVGMFPRDQICISDPEITRKSIKEYFEDRSQIPRGFAFQKVAYYVLDKFYKETNLEVSVYLNKEAEYERDIWYTYDVIYHEYYECEAGSRLHLRYKKGSLSPTWTLNEVNAQSDCDPQEGFEKKKADIKDSGKYECKVDGRVMRIFDVIVYGTYEVKLGETIHLEVEENLKCPTWTLNRKYVSSECDPQKGFEKKNADFTDSGTYRCIVGMKVSNVFKVIVCGIYEVKFGETIHLEVEENLKCPSWTLNGKNVSSECDPQKGFEKTNADFTDSGMYRCIVGNTVSNVFQVIVYEYLFEDEFIGIRISVPGEATGKKPGILSKQNQVKRNENISKNGFEGIKIKQTDDPVSPDPPEDDPHKPDPPEGDPDTPDPPEGEMVIENPEYPMDRNPRGLAVIISISEFDDEQLGDIFQMTRADAGYCVDTFRHFNFLIRESCNNNADGILQFLTAIANEDHSACDCLVLYVSSHGANGYFCCRDYDRNNQTGFITYNDMLSLFLTVPSLAGKPKLVFIDSCRQNQLDVLVPIGIVDEQDLQERFANILIGYAAIVGAPAVGDNNGSFYTRVLTTCIRTFAAQQSILDVMTAVISTVYDRYNRIPVVQSTLRRRLVMILPAPAP